GVGGPHGAAAPPTGEGEVDARRAARSPGPARHRGPAAGRPVVRVRRLRCGLTGSPAARGAYGAHVFQSPPPPLSVYKRDRRSQSFLAGGPPLRGGRCGPRAATRGEGV